MLCYSALLRLTRCVQSLQTAAFCGNSSKMERVSERERDGGIWSMMVVIKDVSCSMQLVGL